jgi:hypothetical protein
LHTGGEQRGLSELGGKLMSMLSAIEASCVPELSRLQRAYLLPDDSTIGDLGAGAMALLDGQSSTARPEFFLATLSRRRWIPRVVVVEDGAKIIGLVYAKERKVTGMRTGLVYADSTLGNMVVSAAEDREKVFARALEALLKAPGVQGLRLMAPPDGFEPVTARNIAKSLDLDLHEMPVENHSILRLCQCYEDFLQGLSSKTRRNFRYFRNRSEAANHKFVEQVPLSDFRSAAHSLMSEDVVGADSGGIERGINIFAAAERPLLVGLEDEHGKWLSIVGGWYEGDRAYIFLQMNSDRQHARYSLSLVMRAKLIEMLIGQGVREMLWWAGVGPPISHYVQQVPTCWVYLDKRTFFWRAFRSLLNAQRGWLPAKLQTMAEWIVPAPSNTPAPSVSKNE